MNGELLAMKKWLNLKMENICLQKILSNSIESKPLKVIGLLSVVLSASCGDLCYSNLYLNITDYPVNPNAVTPSGIQVDTFIDLDLQRLDQRISQIETCLKNLVGAEYIISQKEMIEWQCLKNTFYPEEFKRNCLVIKVVEPVFSQCSDWHFIDALAPQEQCEAKGLEQDKNCPCRYRWAIQNENVLITPPGHLGDLYLYDLVKIWTGCNNYWISSFSICAEE